MLSLPDTRVLRPICSALLIIAAAYVLAACGGSDGVSKTDYVKQLNRAVATLQKSTTSLGPDASGGASAATRLEQGAKAMDAAAADFSRIAPPGDAEHAHGRIVDGLHRFGDTFRDAADAARAKDDKRLLSVLSGLDSSPGARELQAATQELASKGYNVQ
jgi:hypothetical protein